MNNLLYDALMLGRNKKVEQEEFLVATDEKEPASFRTGNENIEIANVISDGEFCVQLFQDSPGYFEIEVLCSDNFIVFDKKVITSDDFSDGRYEFRFMVISDRLHNGINYTQLSFLTVRQCVSVSVTVDNKIRIRLGDFNPRKKIIELGRLYTDLHSGLIQSREWAFKVIEILSDDISGDDEKSLNLMLLKAQAYLSIEDSEHARNYIEYIGTQIPKLENKNYDLYCYFIYLAALYEELAGIKNSALCTDIWNLKDDPGPVVPFRKEDFSRSNTMDMSAVQKVRWVYYHHPSWNILYMLLYMDPYCRSDRSFVIEEMKKLFYECDCISRIMYLEAYSIYQSDLSYMSGADDFEIHVMFFAVKNNCITSETANRFAELITEAQLADEDDGTVKLILQILKTSYDKFGGKLILQAICAVLVDKEIRDSENHIYFEKAFRAGFENDVLFDYYIYTFDENVKEPVPPVILKYFLDRIELFYEYRKNIFANIVENEFSAGEYYETSINSIVKFAERQMIQGQNDETLSVIYKHLLDKKLITANMKNNLYDVLCTKKILCRNQRIQSVLVFHNELQIYQESIIRNEKAYIKIYSSDALILFKDYTGNLFRKIDFDVDQLINVKDYIDICFKDTEINRFMLMGDTYPLLRAYKNPLEILLFFTSRKISGQFRKSYEQELLKSTISYYAKNSRDDAVYDELIKFREFDLPTETRGILIGVMLKRGLVDDAYDELRYYGSCGLDNEHLAELAGEYIKVHGNEKNDVITMLCEAGYDSSGFNEYILDYLYKNYTGSLVLLANIYRAAKLHGWPVDVIEERILIRNVTVSEYTEIVPVAFKHYYENGGNKELCEQYYQSRCRKYLGYIMKEGINQSFPADLEFFEYLENDMQHGFAFTDECLIADILYRTGTEVINDRLKHMLENNIKNLVNRGKMLEEFKYYSRYFELPSTLVNNIIVSAFSEDPADRPKISFEITGAGETSSGEEEMEEIFEHCFVKYFTLFYGEKVVFSMNGKQSSVIRYEDIAISNDGSRYAQLDEIIRLGNQPESETFYKAVEDFYIKERLIEYLL